MVDSGQALVIGRHGFKPPELSRSFERVTAELSNGSA
jgi:hypothetical protein